MKKMYALVFACAFALVSPLNTLASSKSLGEECKEKLKKDFPRTVVTEINESPVAGVCEVVAGTNVLLYSPSGYLFVGSLYNAKGDDLIQTKKDDVTKKAFAKMPLEHAIKSGNGPVQVVEFTDLDCPYCIGLKKEFAKTPDLQSKITLYTFLFPLDQLHPRSSSKSRWVFCQADQEKAITDIMIDGKFKEDTGFIEFPPECKINDTEKRLFASREAGQAVGVQGTPTLFIDGKKIQGKPEDIIATINKAFEAKSGTAKK